MKKWTNLVFGGLALIGLTAAGCGGEAFTGESSDGSAGRASDDASALDTGTQNMDALPPSPDSAAQDASSVADSADQDTSSDDVVVPSRDSGGSEGGSQDSGVIDAGPSDAGLADSGRDSSPDADTSCVTGASITFVLKVGADASTTYCSGISCGADWLSVRPVGKSAVPTTASCETTCSSCQPIACANLCIAPSVVPMAGLHETWDGTVYPESTCGSGISCITQSCAEHGSYIARMCAVPEATPIPGAGTVCPLTSGSPKCVEVGFDWPPQGGSAVVAGTLDP